MHHAQLRAFHAVATCGGFSRAAAELGISQPAVSDHVRKLEEAYGVQLFVRGRRSVTLTDLGRKLYALTERQFEASAAAVDLLAKARRLEEGSLVFGADAAVHILPLMAALRRAYPRVRQKLIGGNSARLIEMLERFDIDFAVVAEVPALPQFASRLLRESHLAAFVATSHPWAKRKRIAFAELAQMPLVLREQGSVTRKLLEQELNARSIAPEAVFEVEGREAAREAVAQGFGLGIVSAGEFVDDRRLRLLAFTDWHAPMREWLVCLEARTGLHLVAAVLELVRKAFSAADARSPVARKHLGTAIE